MGWQDRDWAKFDDEELRELYGVTPQPADPARAWIWSLVVVVRRDSGHVSAGS
jgi:hypothetical protein